MNLISDRLSTASIKYFNWPSPVFGWFQNGCNKVVIEPRVVQFWSEIILVISNRTRAARSFDFEITRMISAQIALLSVQLPLLTENRFLASIGIHCKFMVLVSNGVMYRMNMASEFTYGYTNIPAYVHQLNILQTQGTVKSPHSLFEERRHERCNFCIGCS